MFFLKKDINMEATNRRAARRHRPFRSSQVWNAQMAIPKNQGGNIYKGCNKKPGVRNTWIFLGMFCLVVQAYFRRNICFHFSEIKNSK